MGTGSYFISIHNGSVLNLKKPVEP